MRIRAKVCLASSSSELQNLLSVFGFQGMPEVCDEGRNPGKDTGEKFPLFYKHASPKRYTLRVLFLFFCNDSTHTAGRRGLQWVEAGYRELVHPRQRSAACLPRHCCALWHAYPVTPPASLPQAVLGGPRHPATVTTFPKYHSSPHLLSNPQLWVGPWYPRVL